MKPSFLLLLFFLRAGLSAQSPASPPRYVFFLHNLFIELQGLEGSHPEYGRAEYKEIIRAFEKQSFKVISEIRPKNTDVNLYAARVAGQIDSLLKQGVAADHITVIGTSKGGAIAREVSGLAKNKALNFVFIGCCVGPVSAGHGYYGNILSIYEKDDTGSCAPLLENSRATVSHFKEIELHTGLKHGFLYKPLKEWIEPSAKWARQEF